MKFSNLSSYFDKLEKTYSRLELIKILSELFKQVEKGEEVEKICYLVQGRIAPFFEATEIGMAEKTVATAVAQALGVDREEVLIEFDRLGDFGLAAEKLAKETKRDPRFREDERKYWGGWAHFAVPSCSLTHTRAISRAPSWSIRSTTSPTKASVSIARATASGIPRWRA